MGGGERAEHGGMGGGGRPEAPAHRRLHAHAAQRRAAHHSGAAHYRGASCRFLLSLPMEISRDNSIRIFSCFSIKFRRIVQKLCGGKQKNKICQLITVFE